MLTRPGIGPLGLQISPMIDTGTPARSEEAVQKLLDTIKERNQHRQEEGPVKDHPRHGKTTSLALSHAVHGRTACALNYIHGTNLKPLHEANEAVPGKRTARAHDANVIDTKDQTLTT